MQWRNGPGFAIVGVLAAAIAGGACDRTRTRAETGVPERAPPAARAQLAEPHTFDYVAQMNEIEIRAARSVMEDGQPEPVRTLAQRIVADHGDLQERVERVAETLGVSADAGEAEPIPVIQRIATDVDLLPQIEAERRSQLYLERTVAAHEAWIDMVRSLRDNESMPEVQAMLASIIPVLEEHQESALKALEDLQIRPVGGQD